MGFRRITVRASRRARVAVAATLVAATGVTSLVIASPAEAGVACTSDSRHYNVQDGSVPINVAWIQMNIEVCTNGSVVTSSSAVSSSDTTGPGDAAGFNIGFGPPYRTSFSSGGPTSAGGFGYTSDGSLRDCIPYTTLMCGYTENFELHVQVYMYQNPARIPYALPPGGGWWKFQGRWFKDVWTGACTNRVCAVHLH